MSSQRDNLREDVHFRVLKILEDNPKISQRGLSEELGVSLGAINYCLNAMIDKGLIKLRNFRASDSKLRYAYTITPKGIAERAKLTRNFLARKLREYDALKSEIADLQAELGE